MQSSFPGEGARSTSRAMECLNEAAIRNPLPKADIVSCCQCTTTVALITQYESMIHVHTHVYIQCSSFREIGFPSKVIFFSEVKIVEGVWVNV